MLLKFHCSSETEKNYVGGYRRYALRHGKKYPMQYHKGTGVTSYRKSNMGTLKSEDQLRAVIRAKHYSRYTEVAYVMWYKL